jgi:hypothetical protein
MKFDFLYMVQTYTLAQVTMHKLTAEQALRVSELAGEVDESCLNREHLRVQVMDFCWFASGRATSEVKIPSWLKMEAK